MLFLSARQWLFVLICLPAFFSITGCSTEQGPEQTPGSDRIIPVEIAEVKLQEQAFPIHTGGRLSAKAQMKLSFKIGGIIAQIHSDEGDYVREGQMMAELNLTEIDAQVAQAQSAFDKAQRDLTRMETLYRDSVVTRTQLQDTRTGYETMKAQLEMIQFNRSFAMITAPLDGRILRRLAEENEMVAPGQPVFVMSAIGHGWVVRMGLPDRDVVKLNNGDRATVHFDAYPDRIFEGQIAEISEAADPRTGTFEVEVQVSDPGRLLKAGFFARVELHPSLVSPNPMIPIEALVEGDDLEGIVFELDRTTNKVRKIVIGIARITDEEIVVHSGLEDVSFVVTSGAAYLEDGDVVRVVSSQNSGQ